VRVVSMLPAATEIVFALGLGDDLVAVSHDCDHPAAVRDKPPITHCEIHDASLSSGEVDAWVRETLEEQGTLYTIDEPLLRRLEPDVILTQQLCDVCAPSYGSVEHLAATLARPPRVVNLEPSSLADILDDIRLVAGILDVPMRGETVVAELERRIEAVRMRAADADRPLGCVLLEWLDPPFRSGHWGPELVRLAGGVEELGRPGQDSVRVAWDDVVAAAPEVLVLACCGNSVQQTLSELPPVTQRDGWSHLPAVRNGRVYVADGGAYFSRPGPRIVDSLELLAGMLHPDIFPEWSPSARPREQVVWVEGGTAAERESE
jgi:iron complex transport system substrate-binding protein